MQPTHGAAKKPRLLHIREGLLRPARSGRVRGGGHGGRRAAHWRRKDALFAGTGRKDALFAGTGRSANLGLQDLVKSAPRCVF